MDERSIHRIRMKLQSQTVTTPFGPRAGSGRPAASRGTRLSTRSSLACGLSAPRVPLSRRMLQRVTSCSRSSTRGPRAVATRTGGRMNRVRRYANGFRKSDIPSAPDQCQQPHGRTRHTCAQAHPPSYAACACETGAQTNLPSRLNPSALPRQTQPREAAWGTTIAASAGPVNAPRPSPRPHVSTASETRLSEPSEGRVPTLEGLAAKSLNGGRTGPPGHGTPPANAPTKSPGG